jgi:hypothetical protein
MSTILSPAPKLQFFTEGGIPLAGGKLYSYAAGTTTPLATYTTSTGIQNNTNPIILDSRGEAAVWLDAASYKLTLTDSNDVEIWTVDNITTQDAMNALTAFEASLASSQGSSLVGYAPASGPPNRTVQSKLRDVVSVKDFGAVGDGTTDDTTALQAAIAYCENVEQYGGRALYIPGGRYKISAPLTLSKEFITIFGDGAWESQIYAVGLSTSALATANIEYLRPFLHDFGIVNTGTGKGIDFSNIFGQVYLGELKNLYIESGDDGFYAPRFFSMVMMNVSSLSRTGHSFRVACGPGVNWIGCYALECGPGKAGYRLRGLILMNACNGLNEGDFWGVFGSNPTNLDGFQSDFPDNDFPDITLLNCNLERWGSLTTGGEAVRVVNTYRNFTFIGGKIDRFDLATNYSAIINCFAGSNGGTEPVRLGIGSLFMGGGTPSLANLYSSGQAFYFDTNDQFYTGGIISFKQGATIYPILRQWVAGDIFGNNAHYFSAISPRRNSIQMVRYDEFPAPVFTATISAFTMTVTAVSTGVLSIGQVLTGGAITAGTYITAFVSGAGGPGTYTVSASQTLTSTQLTGTSQLTPVGAAQVINVTGHTKVVVTPAAAASITQATFDATPNTVSDFGRNGDLLIEAGNANLTINHSASGANTFKLTGGVNLTLAAGQVVRFCLSDTGGNWWQV